MSSIKLATAIIIMAQSAGCDPLFGGSFESAFLTACDEVMKDRLKAPSTYTRIAAHGYEQRPATLDDKRGWTNATKRAEDLKMIETDPRFKELYEMGEKVFEMSGEQTLTRAFVEYDADNSYGVPVRGAYECTHVGFDVDEFAPAAGGVRVDGYNSVDWSARELQRLRGLLD